MQRWIEEITKHPLNSTLKELIEAVDSGISIEDPIVEAERVRFLKVLNLLSDVLKRLDPEIAPIQLLDQINSHLLNQGVLQDVRDIRNNFTIDALRSINTRINPIIIATVQLRAAAKGLDSGHSGLKSATSAFEKFARELDKSRRAHEKFIADVEARVSGAQADMEQSKTNLKGDSDLYKINIQKWGDESSSLLATQRQTFAELNANSTTLFSETIAAIKSDASAQMKKLFDSEKAAADKLQAHLQSRSEKIIADVEETHRKIKSLYGLVATDSVSGGHQQIADREQDAATLWRQVTVGSIVLAIFWLLYTLFCLNPTDETPQIFWLQIGKSISLTALLLSLAVYASKQAALHRANERRFRSFFLQVQAFDPFIENLSEVDKQELKKALSARIFGPEETKPDDAVLDQPSLSVVKELLAMVAKVKS